MKILKNNERIIFAVMLLFLLYMLWQAFRPTPKYVAIPFEATTTEEYTENQTEEQTQPNVEIRQIVEKSTEKATEQEEKSKSFKKVKMLATAYCPCKKCCGKYAENRPKDENGKEIVITASGTRAKAGRTIAVDKSIIPFGAEIIIDGNTYIAEDTGGAIYGNRIDIYFDNHEEALNFGRKTITVLIKNSDV